MKVRTFSAAVLILGSLSGLGCDEPRVAVPTPTPATPPVTPTPPPPTPAPSVDPNAPPTDLAHARALPLGPPITIEIPCAGSVFVGPFAPSTEGETVRLASDFVTSEQTCPGAGWVDGTGAQVENAGVGCSDTGQHAVGEQTYRYAPGEGANAATPVYLRLTLEEIVGPAVCAPVSLQLARAQ